MKRFLVTIVVLFVSLIAGWSQQVTFSPQWTPQSQFAGYYAAYENGYYTDAGLDVRIIHPTKSKGAMIMLEDGSADIITSELIQAMMAPDNGTYMVNLLQTTQHSTLVLISRNKEIDELSDLAGSRIGTWKIGFNEIPHMIDEEEGLEIEWIKFLNSINLYLAGAIDATLAKSYNELILFSMSGITPGSVLYFADHGFDIPEDGLYTTEKFYKENPDVCRRFAEASRKGWEWVRNNREKALEIVMKYIKAENVTTNYYHQKWMLDTILDVQEEVKGEAPSFILDRKDVESLNESLLKYRYISAPIDFNRFTGGSL